MNHGAIWFVSISNLDLRNIHSLKEHDLRRLAYAIILLFVLPLLASSQPHSIPVTISPEGMILISAKLGATPINVIFDTGAGLDVLAPSLIEKVHGKPAGEFSAFRMTGERLAIPLFVVPELSVGPVVIKDATVGSWDLLDQMHLDGIVSANDFRHQPFTLDFPGKFLIFETSKSLSGRRSAGHSAPMQLDDYRGIALDPFAHFSLAGQAGQCEIDSGSQNATVNTRYMPLLHVDKDSNDVKKRETTTVAGAKQIRYIATLPQISLADATQVSLDHPHLSFSDLIYDCVIGLDFWQGRALTIDIPDRQLFVSDREQRADDTGH